MKVHRDTECVAADASIARLEAKNIEMAAALRATAVTLHYTVEHMGTFEDCRSADCTKARAALSGEGKVWEQVEKALEHHIRICPLSPDLKAALAAMKGE